MEEDNESNEVGQAVLKIYIFFFRRSDKSPQSINWTLWEPTKIQLNVKRRTACFTHFKADFGLLFRQRFLQGSLPIPCAFQDGRHFYPNILNISVEMCDSCTCQQAPTQPCTHRDTMYSSMVHAHLKGHQSETPSQFRLRNYFLRALLHHHMLAIWRLTQNFAPKH